MSVSSKNPALVPASLIKGGWGGQILHSESETLLRARIHAAGGRWRAEFRSARVAQRDRSPPVQRPAVRGYALFLAAPSCVRRTSSQPGGDKARTRQPAGLLPPLVLPSRLLRIVVLLAVRLLHPAQRGDEIPPFSHVDLAGSRAVRSGSKRFVGTLDL